LSAEIASSALGGEPLNIGTTQGGHAVAKVVESKNANYPVGTIFTSRLPWRRYAVGNGDFGFEVTVIKKPNKPDNFFDRLGLLSTLGSLGMPSQTAYYGSKYFGNYTEKDVLVVSGAAGAVGSVLGQLAKKVYKVKKVIGVAGGKTKCDILTKEYGFDAAIDYKEYNTKAKMAARLKEVAGDTPITAYYDNTGGFVTDAVFDVIARHGRIIVCGQISSYHTGTSREDDNNYPNYLAKTIYNSISIRGFLVLDYIERNDKEFYAEFPKWVEAGLIKTKETVVEGFENIPKAYEMLFTGANTGKIIVRVSGSTPAPVQM